MTLYGHPRFYELLEEESRIHSDKNHDYASSEDPLKNFREVGKTMGMKAWKVAYFFVVHKFYRLVNLLQSGKTPLNESVPDTLTDMSIYIKLFRILWEEEEEKKIAERSRQVAEDEGYGSS